jgi:hypothetical protein
VRSLITRHWITNALTVSLLTLAAGIARADFKSDYSDGIKAADKANWANTRAKMQSAIAAEPNPQARVRLYGMVFSAYIPHYYLALAAFKMGDCAGATAALNNGAHQAFMRQAKGVEDQLAQSKLILNQCAAKSGTLPSTTKPPIAPPAPPAPNVPSNLPSSAPPLVTNTAPDPKIAAEAAARAALAEQAREAKLAAEKLAAQQASAPAPPVPVVAKPPPPAELTRIAASYFAGNLKEAALNNLTGLSGKALAHGLLLRAAAKYAIYQQQGAKNAQQLLDLKADLLGAKRADATAKPTARYFSREFIGLYAAP